MNLEIQSFRRPLGRSLRASASSARRSPFGRSSLRAAAPTALFAALVALAVFTLVSLPVLGGPQPVSATQHTDGTTGFTITVDVDSTTDGDQTTLEDTAENTKVKVTVTAVGAPSDGLVEKAEIDIEVAQAAADDTTKVVSLKGNPTLTEQITLPAGETSKTTTFTLNVDDSPGVLHGDGTVEVSGKVVSTSDYKGLPVTAANITLTDSEPAAVTVSLDTTTLKEDAALTPVKVTIATEGGGTYGVELSVELIVAGSGGDNVVSFMAPEKIQIKLAMGETSTTTTFDIDPTPTGGVQKEETVTVSGMVTGPIGLRDGVVTVGSATITLTDPVAPAPGDNVAPTVEGEVRNLRLRDDGRLRNVETASVFKDSVGDTLTYEVSSKPARVAKVLIDKDDGTVRVQPQRRGRAEVTVTATDSGGLSVSHTFLVTVSAAVSTATPVAPVTTPPAEVPGVGGIAPSSGLLLALGSAGVLLAAAGSTIALRSRRPKAHR